MFYGELNDTNLAYADAYADLLWEENIFRSLKSTAEVVQANRAISIFSIKFFF